MKKIWNGAFALLILTMSWQHALAQEAASSLNGIWFNEESEALAFLTIIHKDNGQLAIIGSRDVDLVLVRGLLSGASLGQADPTALGENIGTAMSFPAAYYNADLSFNLHRPSADELLIELTSCSVPEGNAASCELIQEQSGFTLNVRVRHTRAF
ncbi:MAG: hypothetical protein OXI13_02240 [Gammaproteobacteria bacterium]|nr:hypothetical protein [Gammaproteobacteria bacterium]